jgi:hypothetical protein
MINLDQREHHTRFTNLLEANWTHLMSNLGNVPFSYMKYPVLKWICAQPTSPVSAEFISLRRKYATELLVRIKGELHTPRSNVAIFNSEQLRSRLACVSILKLMLSWSGSKDRSACLTHLSSLEDTLYHFNCDIYSKIVTGFQAVKPISKEVTSESAAEFLTSIDQSNFISFFRSG